MTVAIAIPSIYAGYTNNRLNLKAEGKTMGECLRDLARRYPEFGKILLDENGDVAALFDVYVNEASAYPLTMTRPVKDGDKLHIVPIIEGG